MRGKGGRKSQRTKEQSDLMIVLRTEEEGDQANLTVWLPARMLPLRKMLSLKVEMLEREAENVTRAAPSVNLTPFTTVATVAPANVTSLMVTASDEENEATLVVQVRVD